MQILNRTADIERLYFLRALGYRFVPQVTNFGDYNSEFLDLEALNREINSCALCSLKKIGKSRANRARLRKKQSYDSLARAKF